MSLFVINKKQLTGLEHALHNIIMEPGDTEAIFFEKYKMCSHLRHDFLHILVSEILGVEAHLGITKPIRDVLQSVDFHTFGKLTPDIVFENQGKVFLIDVSVSFNPEHELQSKTVKYLPLQSMITEQYKSCEMHFICINPSLENLDEELFKLSAIGFPVNQALVDNFIYLHSVAQKKLSKLRPLIPTHFFKDEMQEFKTSFRPELDYQKIYEKNKHYKLDTIRALDDDQATEIFMELFDDPEVKKLLKDKEHHVSRFEKAFDDLKLREPNEYCTPKPTFHFLYAPSEKIPTTYHDTGFKQDQQNILNILSFVKSCRPTEPSLCLLSELFDQMVPLLSDKIERNLFQTGFYTGNYADDIRLKTHYYETCINPKGGGHENEKKKRVSGVSIRQTQLLPCKQERPYFERSHQLSIGRLSPTSQGFVDKSGVQFIKRNPAGRVYKTQNSCDPTHASEFESFYNLLCEQHKVGIAIDPIWELPIGKDSLTATFLKKRIRDDFRLFYKQIYKTHAHHMSFHTSLAADQLIHYNNLNTKAQSFLFINTGLPNVMHVVQGGTVNKAKDIGQPFFSIAITTDERWANSCFGGYKKIRLPGNPKYFLIVTNWRRLQTHKLTLLRDQYYSAQSTGYDTFARNPRVPHGCNLRDYLKFIYVFKSVVSQSTSQRIAEFLMDVRYIVMACFSDYTNVAELISDKFSPHYPNAFSRWIVTTLETKVFDITNAYQKKGSKKMLTPIFKGKERIQDSLGGKISLPAVWSNFVLNDIQDLYDELFVYVLTGKEPSSNFHEGIKSLNTILKYQEEYDHLTDDEQLGIHTPETFKNLLMKKGTVGCYYQICEYSARNVSENLANPKLISDLAKVTTCEVLSEIVSTKSCIPEYSLTEVDLAEVSSKDKDKKKIVRDVLESRGLNVLSENTYVPKKLLNVHPFSVVNPVTYTNRAKVHDLCYDFIVRFPEESQHTLDVANWNIFKNSNRVEAHICIKAQYGAKREFYVVNFGAKAMVRIYENMFKAIATQLPQEMISVPGDKKMNSMYQNVNEVLHSSKGTTDHTFFVNGDCTKWSACETMASFWGLVNGFRGILSPEQVAFSKCVLSGWSNKLIEIPKDVQQGTKFITDKTQYMLQGDYIRSTQNFLQGMFNYSSSVKAVCATELAIKMWNKRYSSSRPIFVRHLEHSDDYSLIVRVRNVEDFVDFRIMHRLAQKLHGINDSTKKTNSQQFIMEFISLMCYNGRMSYPNIKKTKEVGINIAGTGYHQDIMNVISRSSEAMRLGVPQESCYVVQILQGINIYRKYSLNSRNRSEVTEDPFNYPPELYGLPDCLPVYYMSSVTDPNTYRLMKYSPRSLKLLKGLYVLTNKLVDNDISAFSMEMIPTFFTPIYKYYRTSRKLKYIRQTLNANLEEILLYKEKFPEYTICKPRETGNFRKWLKFMYYNQSFSTAYTQASRQAIMLRLSHFASGECVQDPLSDKLLTICDFIPYYFNLLKELSNQFLRQDLLNLERIALGSDPVLKGIFSLMDGATISTSRLDPSPPLVMQLPNGYKFLKFENNLYSVIQYCVNEENFWVDRRQNYGIDSLKRDEDKLMTLLGNAELTPSNILLLAKLLKAQRQKNSVGICYGSPSNNPIELCISTIEQGTFYDTRYKLISGKDFKVINPLTKEVMYSRSFDKIYNRDSLILEEVSLLIHFLRYKLEWDTPKIYEVAKMVKDKESGLLLGDCIQKMNFDLTTPSDIFHKRMFSFMKSFICQDNSALYELVGNAYAVQHSYLNKITLSDLRKHSIYADDGVMFVFRGNTYLAVKGSANNVLLICQTTTITQASFSYLIACRLFNIITQSNFEKMIQFNLHNCMPLVSTPLLRELCGQESPLFFHRIGSTILTSHSPEKAFPIMMKCEVPKYPCNKYLHIPNNPEIDLESLMVRSGRLKLFSLPFWPCGEHSVLDYPNIEFSGFNINILNTPGLLYSYLHSKHTEYIPTNDQKSHLIQYYKKKPFDMSVHGFPKLNDEQKEQLNAKPTKQLRQELTKEELMGISITGNFGLFEDEQILGEDQHPKSQTGEDEDNDAYSIDFSLFGFDDESSTSLTKEIGGKTMEKKRTEPEGEKPQKTEPQFNFSSFGLFLDQPAPSEIKDETLQHPKHKKASLDFGSFGFIMDDSSEEDDFLLDDIESEVPEAPAVTPRSESLDFETFGLMLNEDSTDDDILMDNDGIDPLGNERQESIDNYGISFESFGIFRLDNVEEEDAILDDTFHEEELTIPSFESFKLEISDPPAFDPLGVDFTWHVDDKKDVERLRDEAIFQPTLEYEETDYSSDDLLDDTSSEENAEFMQMIRSYVQLSNDKAFRYEGGYTKNYISELPDFEIFLMRCWTGFEEGFWANNPKMQFQIIRLIYEVQKENIDIPVDMDLILRYAYCEVRHYIGKKYCDNVVHLKGGKAEFIGYRLVIKDVHCFFNQQMAEIAAKRRGVSTCSIKKNEEDMFEFAIERSLDEDFLANQYVKLYRSKNLLYSTLFDIASVLGIIEIAN